MVVEEGRGSFSSDVTGLLLVYKPASSEEEVSIELMTVKENEDEAKIGKEWLLALKKV